MSDGLLILRLAQIVARLGLAMSGAVGATFVAALLMRAELPWFDTVEFTLLLIVLGMIGAYLGIDIPRAPLIGLASATGTFLAAGAGLLALYAFVFDETSDAADNLLFGATWMLGVCLQIGAGLAGRRRIARVRDRR
ncbi:hypothetical protein L6654_11720 [Bradyrhizobium sp. WYCCWR 13023]|uniref:Uncharacterized protein n=1 Tax=Bradyrhizobium zhengyangense TaxID=2911009 RepID=A0A9X1U9D6_9BRAD|nr:MULTISPECIES: hypothetical protein [Bradyrhizobium]MCG2627299.1 hypothetical protein [Bradyrhizobium zhengyangense]MCG2642043.1 hypothetical protein [Bradyrhizobium zhengyangense]MCG2668046.1 hypothetical protein [Bradyrhizobium zhengyangense]MDA9521795.1 hypothetical protein [Bradyrhizobium sp. CCBAU 11434]